MRFGLAILNVPLPDTRRGREFVFSAILLEISYLQIRLARRSRVWQPVSRSQSILGNSPDRAYGLPAHCQMQSVDDFRARCAALGLTIEAEDAIETAPASPLAQPIDVEGRRLGNRWVIHPMEGWDGEADGRVSELVRPAVAELRAQRRQMDLGGRSDGGSARGPRESAAVGDQRIDRGIAEVAARRLAGDPSSGVRSADDLLTGFQLTHSGRFSRPTQAGPAPKILYRHPLLDRKFGLADDHPILTDDEIKRIIDRFIAAGRIAERCGAEFVDVKHCHGYLGHEFLSAVTRPGPYAGLSRTARGSCGRLSREFGRLPRASRSGYA